MDSNNQEWMAVYITNSLPEAHIVAGRLQSENIRAWVHSEPGASAIGIHIGSLGEIKVLVPPAHYEQALALLDDDMMESLPDSTDEVVLYDEDGNLITFEDDDDDFE